MQPAIIFGFIKLCSLTMAWSRTLYPSQSLGSPALQPFSYRYELVHSLHDTGLNCGRISFRIENFDPAREPG